MQESFYSSKTDEIWSIWTHAEEVQASIPPGRLLVFDVRIGNIFLTLKKSFPLSRITLKKSPTSLKPFESIKGKGWLGSTLCLPWTSEAFYALPKKQQWSTGSHFFCGNYKWIITILNKVQLLASQLRRTAYVGVLGAPLILSVLVPFCHSTWQLCLTPILPCLFLWSVVKFFVRTLDGDL